MPRFSLPELLAEYRRLNRTDVDEGYDPTADGQDVLYEAPISSKYLDTKIEPELPSGLKDSLKATSFIPKELTIKDYGEKFGPPGPPVKSPAVGSSTTAQKIASAQGDTTSLGKDGTTIDTVDEAGNAQKIASQARLANELARAGELIGSGISGTKPVAQDILKDQAEKSENIVKQYLQRAKQEDSDPNSVKSNFARESMKALGVQVPSNVSYEAIQKAFPQFVQMRNIDEQIAARKEMAQLRKEELDLRQKEKEAQKGEKKVEKDEKFVQSLRKELSAGEVGKARVNYMTAKKAENAVAAFSKNPTGYSDYGSLMLGLKALQGDQSVVREAEIRLGTNAASLFQKAENAIQRAMTGRSLQPDQRDAIKESVNMLSNIAKEQYREMASPIVTQAKSQGYDINKLLDKKSFPEFFDEEKSELKPQEPVSDVTALINSRTEDENKKRLEMLKKKYGR